MKREPTLFDWWNDMSKRDLTRGVVVCSRGGSGLFYAEPANQRTFAAKIFDDFADAIHYARTGEKR